MACTSIDGWSHVKEFNCKADGLRNIFHRSGMSNKEEQSGIVHGIYIDGQITLVDNGFAVQSV